MLRLDRCPTLAMIALTAALLLVACGSGSAPPPSGPSSAAPSAPPSASVDTPDEAAALVLATSPTFEGLGRKDPDLVGQCCWYETRRVDDGFEVIVELGWGDCPAGCIDRHRWTYAVAPNGAVGLIEETGEPIPSGGVPGDGS